MSDDLADRLETQAALLTGAEVAWALLLREAANEIRRLSHPPQEHTEQEVMPHTTEHEASRRRNKSSPQGTVRDPGAGFLKEGHGAPCNECSEPCDGLADNPGLWPVALCDDSEPGKVAWYHTHCAMELIRAAKAQPTLPPDVAELVKRYRILSEPRNIELLVQQMSSRRELAKWLNDGADALTRQQAEIARLTQQLAVACDDFVKALRSARLEGQREMRERCAKLADEQFAEPGWHAFIKQGAATVANRIRALDSSLPETPSPAACSRSPER